MKRMLLIMISTVMVLCGCNNMAREGTREITKEKNEETIVEPESENESDAPENLTFDFSKISYIQLTDGNNGNSAKITEENMIQEIEQLFQSSIWKRGESSQEIVGVGFVIEFFEEESADCAYKIDVSGDEFKYNGYFYSSDDYTLDVEKYRNYLSTKVK